MTDKSAADIAYAYEDAQSEIGILARAYRSVVAEVERLRALVDRPGWREESK